MAFAHPQHLRPPHRSRQQPTIVPTFLYYTHDRSGSSSTPVARAPAASNPFAGPFPPGTDSLSVHPSCRPVAAGHPQPDSPSHMDSSMNLSSPSRKQHDSNWHQRHPYPGSSYEHPQGHPLVTAAAAESPTHMEDSVNFGSPSWQEAAGGSASGDWQARSSSCC
jgi:hypothetical protein